MASQVAKVSSKLSGKEVTKLKYFGVFICLASRLVPQYYPNDHWFETKLSSIHMDHSSIPCELWKEEKYEDFVENPEPRLVPQ